MNKGALTVMLGAIAPHERTVVSMSNTPSSAGAVELSPEDRTVADLVAEDPRRAAVFERVGIDYCCGGAVVLSKVCSDQGLDLATVTELLVDATRDDVDERNWNDATVQELIDNIVEVHHGYMATALPRLTLLAHKVARAHGDREPAMRDAEMVVVQLVDEMRTHTGEEEQDVFPLCIDAAEGRLDSVDAEQLAATLGGLVEDHDDTARHLARLHELTNDFTAPEDACNTWRAYMDALDRLEQDVHRHVHKENHVLFPKVMELLYVARSTD